MIRLRTTVNFGVSLAVAIGITACSGGSGGALPGNVSMGGTSGAMPPPLGPTAAAVGTERAAGTSRSVAAVRRTLDSGSGEQAQSSDAFVDSIGVNSHMTWGVYNDQMPAFMSALRASGIRYIREKLALQPSSQYMNALQSLAGSGIHSVLLADQTDDPQAIASVVRNYVPSISAIEGPNEPNPQYGDWAPALRTYVRNLYSAVKNDSVASKYPVYAPALKDWSGQDAWSTLGDLSAYVDYGNVHDYTGAYVLGDPNIDYVFARIAAVSGSKPVVATENGYSTSTVSNGLSRTLDMSYTLRMLFKQYQRGIRRTWIYQFLDEGTDPTNYWDMQGLMTHSFSPKPAYTAVKNVISLLADPGAVAQKSKLGYTLGGNTDNVTHVLLQKNDGTYYLAMWLNVSDYDPGSRTVLTPAAQQVSVSFGNTMSSISAYGFDDAGNLSSSTIAGNTSSTQLNVTDRVQIFKIVPGGVGSAPTPNPSGPAPVLANTAAHVGLDEGSGTTTRFGGGTAHLIGNAYWTRGVFGSAIALPAGSYVSGPGGIINTAQSFSVSAWLQLQDSSQSRDAIVIQGNQRSAFHLGYIAGRGFGFQVYATDSTAHTSVRASQSGVVPAPGTWYHVVGVYDKTNCLVSLYVDGTYIKSVPGCGAFTAYGATEFGRGYRGTNNYPDPWSGAIDEVNLYQRALTQQEVSTLARRP